MIPCDILFKIKDDEKIIPKVEAICEKELGFDFEITVWKQTDDYIDLHLRIADIVTHGELADVLLKSNILANDYRFTK